MATITVERFGSDDGGLEVRCHECDAREDFYGRFDSDGYFEGEDAVESWRFAHAQAVCPICNECDRLSHEDCKDVYPFAMFYSAVAR